MTVEPSYVPRGSKLRWKSFLFIFIACCLIAYGGQWLLNQRQKKQVDTYGVCGLSNQKTRQLFENQIVDEAQLLSLGDYLYYGETLNLYHETYNRNSQDLFAG